MPESGSHASRTTQKTWKKVVKFSSHGKHMENERKIKMSWKILCCPRKAFRHSSSLAENVQIGCLSELPKLNCIAILKDLVMFRNILMFKWCFWKRAFWKGFFHLCCGSAVKTPSSHVTWQHMQVGRHYNLTGQNSEECQLQCPSNVNITYCWLVTMVDVITLIE